MGGFSTVAGGGPIQVFKTTRTTDFSTTSTTDVLVISMSITLNAKSNLLVILQPFQFHAYNYDAYHTIKLDGTDIASAKSGANVKYSGAIVGLALGVGAGSHTLEFYTRISDSLGASYVYQPIVLTAIAIPA
jgi:hypothetical protein